jgi:surface antigen
MKSFISTLAILAILSLSACTNMQVQRGKNGQVGGVGGAASGAIIGQAIGHNTEATLIGAAIGGLLGYVVGNEMDKNDLRELNQVYERGRSGQPKSWVNPDTGNRYTVVPQPAYTNSNNHQVCRQAKINAWVNGKADVVYTTACRDGYGHWQIQAQR